MNGPRDHGPQDPDRPPGDSPDPDRPPAGPYGAFRPADAYDDAADAHGTDDPHDADAHGTDAHGTDDPHGAGDRRGLTPTEDLLVRALAARAGQLTHHSLRPARPPAPNWAARGRGPLVLALAASVASVALVGTAAVSLLRGPDRAGVADTPPARVSAPPSLTPSPSATPSTRPGTASPTGPSAEPGTTAESPSASGGGAAPPPVERESTPPSRTVTIVYGAMEKTTTLRTGGDGTAFLATVHNTLGRPAENTTDMLTVTVDGGSGTLRPGDVSVSLRDGGDWRAVGATGSSGVEARLTAPGGETLGAERQRVHEVRVSLGTSFPQGVTRLRINVFSDAGSETLDLKG
ncbi:hypothetical protein [Streptomyces roseolilacinus]|uniref:Uncharacterized protein n=1 Tax=Streptomyces roseolilacinus TaxID=66904 RepID=A0A918EJH6_9ACTN|nr:hypothetical protein [Streptomyces roseolilacinus]GGQ05495.1 hypothetical protein GCM10010249_24970 [Streptomyces roseolilacinus]